jgi:RTX calcium-binding nonapeptide repeat (4 copies)
MSTRTARAVGALALTAASLVGTAALAAPAWAATTTARVSFGNLIVTGGPEANGFLFTRAADGAVTVHDTKPAAMTAGTGCTQQDATTVRCSGVENLNVNGGGGDDSIDNDTGSDGGNPNVGLPSTLNGGDGNDRLSGSTGPDQLIGLAGTDRASGNAGVDICDAETESGCEQN